MNPVSLLPIIPILLIALGVAYFGAILLKIDYKRHRFTAIDGLRGYLAMFVFLHHSAIWFFALRTHQWSLPPSFIYAQFGPTSVGLFFMITAFLFISKLIDSYGQSFDWLKLYVSRVMRIMPLYLLAIASLFITVGFVSHFVLREPVYNILLELVQWLFFIQADINLVYSAKLFIAAVVWSLAFEWTFYFSLGIIGALFFRIRTSVITIMITGVFLAVFFVILFQFYPVDTWKRMTPFLGGIAAAFLVRNEKIRRIGSSIWISPVLLLMLCYVLFYYPSIFDLVPFLCMTIIFIAIACGNDLFGMLTLKASCLLGQISYSVYLLHGLILFNTFQFIIGFSSMAKFTSQQHWAIIAGCSAVVVMVCSLTYKYIEKPGIDKASVITNKMKRIWNAKAAFEV